MSLDALARGDSDPPGREINPTNTTANIETFNRQYPALLQPPSHDEGTRYHSMTETPEDMHEHWLKYARPILEAFWHTKYFILMMFKYGQELVLRLPLYPQVGQQS